MERLYDTAEGIETYLKDLEGLNRLIKDRHEAGYERKERLQDWLILGRWMTDTCGNFGDCTLLDDNYKQMDIASTMPPVVARDDIFKKFHVESTSTSGTRCCVPPVRIHCRECGQRWSISNAYDAIVETDTCKIEMGPYIGRSFQDLDNDLRAKEDGRYFIGFDLPLKSPRFVDMTPHPTIKDFYANKDGWIDIKSAMRMDPEKRESCFGKGVHALVFPDPSNPRSYVFQEGDYTYGHVIYYTHKHCFDLRKSRQSRDYYVSIFKDAGFPDPVTRQVPNERCGDQCCMPWQVGQFPFGDIKIGWRSSVISIDWSALKGSPNLLSLFDDVSSTKWEHGVHAEKRDLAVEYLKRIKAFLDADFHCNGAPDCTGTPSEFVMCENGDVAPRCSKHSLGPSATKVPFMEAIVRKVHSL